MAVESKLVVPGLDLRTYDSGDLLYSDNHCKPYWFYECLTSLDQQGEFNVLKFYVPLLSRARCCSWYSFESSQGRGPRMFFHSSKFKSCNFCRNKRDTLYYIIKHNSIIFSAAITSLHCHMILKSC